MAALRDHSVLVTGGSGFVGRHLLAALAPANRVFSLQRRAVPPDARTPGVDYLYCDLLSLDAGDLPTGIDVVIHQAALIDDPGGPSDPGPMELLQANVAATLRLLTVAAARGIPRFVYGSSGSVYGASATPRSEDAPRQPANFYGLSKRLAEDVVQWYGPSFRSAVILRYGTPVGRWCSNALLLSFLRDVADGRPIDLGADRHTLFSPIAVSDLVQLTVLASTLDGPHLFNVGGLEPVSFEQMVRRIGAAIGRDPVVRETSSPASAQHRMLQSERIRAVLGYRDAGSLRDAVAEMAEWWRDSRGGGPR